MYRQICCWCQSCGIYQIEGFLGQTSENIQIALNHIHTVQDVLIYLPYMTHFHYMCNAPDNNAGTVQKYTVLDKCWTNSTL